MKDNKSSGELIVVIAAIVLLLGAITGPATLSRTEIAAQDDDANMAHDSTGIAAGGGQCTNSCD